MAWASYIVKWVGDLVSCLASNHINIHNYFLSVACIFFGYLVSTAAA